MRNLIKIAEEVAREAHLGQLYGTGEPYIIHPTQVALMAKRLGYNYLVQAACYLHDVIEDTDVTEAELRDQFPNEVVDAVMAVTYVGKDYDEKIKQAMTHPIGHVVKFCDASCNFANSTLFGPKPGHDAMESTVRRAGYLVTLLKNLPTPAMIDTLFPVHRKGDVL